MSDKPYAEVINLGSYVYGYGLDPYGKTRKEFTISRHGDNQGILYPEKGVAAITLTPEICRLISNFLEGIDE